jgi:hypothetical protein
VTSGSVNQSVTWNDASKTLSFGWGGSVQLTGFSGSYADTNALIGAGILQLTSDGFHPLI